MVRLDAERALGRRPHGEPGALGPDLPRPRVPEPERRQQVQLGRLRTAVPDRQAHEDIVGRGLTSSDAGEILYALGVFEAQHAKVVHPAVRGLLTHASPEIRSGWFCSQR